MLVNETTDAVKIDPRVKRTRKLLQQAFDQLLVEKDFQSITVQDITERAEVNRATFYAHFEDKYALLDYSVREALQQALEQKLSDTHTFSLANLRFLAITINDFMGQFIVHCGPGMPSNEQMRITAQVQHYVYEVLLAWLTDAQTMATRPHVIDVEHSAAALSWLIFGAGFQAGITHSKQSADQIADQMIAFLTPSLQMFVTEPMQKPQS